MAKKTTPTADRSLTADERETIILMDDGSGIAKISTHQRKIYTKLKNNPAAELVEDLTYGSSAGGLFEIDASLISFRTRKTKRTYTAAQKAAQKEIAVKAGKARIKKDG